MGSSSVRIYDGNTQIGYGACNFETHKKTIAVNVGTGTHAIKAEFNGMTQSQNITLLPEETKEVVFTFDRTEYDLIKAIESIGITMKDSAEVGDNTGTTQNYVFDQNGKFMWDACRRNTNGSAFSAKVSFNISGDIITISGSGTKPAIQSDYAISSVRIKRNDIYIYKQIDLGNAGGFTHWIVQAIYPNLQTNAYVDISADKPNPIMLGRTLNPWAGAGFNSSKVGSCVVLYLNKSIYYLTASICDAGYIPLYDNSYYKAWDEYYNYEKSNPLSATIGLSNVKMSSVPYDLTGSGI